jgi:glutamate synthase domain-containing protein 1
MMMGLNDRIKLRPLVAATKDDFLYIASEESAIRVVCPEPDEVWAPKAGDPVVGVLKSARKTQVVLEGENG